MLGLNSHTDRRNTMRSHGDSGVAAHYFPLHFGNRWVYEFETVESVLTQTVEVVESVTINGSEWYILEFTTQGQSLTSQLIFRTMSDQVLQYNPSRTEESIVVDFARNAPQIGDLSIGFPDERNRTVVVNGHEFVGCMRVTSGYVDSETCMYAPGVGLLESNGSQGHKILTKAVINGEVVVS